MAGAGRVMDTEDMKPAVPHIVKFVRQSGDYADCGVSTLAMLAGVPYEAALAAVLTYEPAVLENGVCWTELRKAARFLGVSTQLLRSYDIEEATGILGLKAEKKRGEDHFTFLWEGRIIDGNGEMWKEPADYFRQYKFRPTWLLVAVNEE